jgi:cytochrome c-type biogenesis protein CcmH/NrfG
MAINKIFALLLILAGAPAWTREAASTSDCQAAASKQPIAGDLARAAQKAGDLRAQFALADAWSDAGCFSDAVAVLQSAVKAHPDNAELETRLRVAKSLVGEEHFFDDLDRADSQAKLKRAIFRCESLSDLEACSDAVRAKPDDAAVLIAQGDALIRAQRPGDALQSYRRAQALAPNSPAMVEKIRDAEAQSPGNAGAPVKIAAAVSEVGMVRASPKNTAPKRYSNAAPPGQTH